MVDKPTPNDAPNSGGKPKMTQSTPKPAHQTTNDAAEGAQKRSAVSSEGKLKMPSRLPSQTTGQGARAVPPSAPQQASHQQSAAEKKPLSETTEMSSLGEPPSPVNTRHLKMPTVTDAPSVTSVTGPLDQVRPWVIEFRVVGTASLLHARVGEAMVIGRGDSASGFAPEVDLTAFDAFSKGVSRKHALITVKNQRLMLRDLNSTNGTRLNNAICAPGEEYRLRHGDELLLGQLRLQVSFAVVPSLTDTQRNSLPDMQQQALNGSGKRVLVIEDDMDIGNVFRMALEYAGYKVTLVNDVTKGLGALFQGMPDAIVLDLMLPDLNGLDLVRYVRKQKTTQYVPLIVISSAIRGYQANQALSAGADAFLGKPVAVEELVKALGNVLASAAAESLT